MENTFASREVCDLIFADYKTNTPFLNMDYANVTTTEITGESIFAHGGKGHPKRIAFTGERGGTLTVETQMQSFKLYQLLTGGEVSSTANFLAREALTVTDGKITLSAVPANDASVNVFAADDDCGTALEITVSGTDVTIANADGITDVVAYYVKPVRSGAKKISIKGSSFPKAFTVYGDTIMKTEDDEVLPYKFVAYKAVPQSNISISMSNSGDPTTITITCDLMTDEKGNMLDLILEDAVSA